MDELLDILDVDGKFTGETALKSEVHKKGLFHQTVHIWFYTFDEKLLVQLRGKNKETHPLLWDVSVAGHIAAGESVETAAIREVQEEIGLVISVEDLQKVGVFATFCQHKDNLIDNEFHHSFLCLLKAPLGKLKKQHVEVEDLALIPIVQFEKELLDEQERKKYVPHELDYYKSIISKIRTKLIR